jgi:hypothetical protein
MVAFELEIPSCTVYFNNNSNDDGKLKYITIVNFPADTREYILEKEKKLFLNYPKTRICKLMKEKENYSTYIKLIFGQNYALLDNDRQPAYLYELRPGTKVAIRAYAKEWSYRRQAGYVLYIRHLIILDPIETIIAEEQYDDNADDTQDEFYLLEQKIIKSLYYAESNSSSESEQEKKTKFRTVEKNKIEKPKVSSAKIKNLNFE